MVKISNSDFEEFSKRKRAAFINSLSGYKALNLIGSISADGKTNVSIISSAFHLGSDPALLGFIIRPDLSPRHTLDNLRENKVCTFNHVNEKIYKKAHQTSARYDRSESEFDHCGLTEDYRDDFVAPFVAESQISISLEFQREIIIEENGTHLIIAKVKDVYLPEDAMEADGFINLAKAGTVCGSGLDSYHTTEVLSRLSYAKPFTEAKVL